MKRGALLVTGLLLAGACREDAAAPPGPQRPSATLEGEPDWTRDDRFVALLAGCPRDSYFDGDTSDLIPILVAKLATGQRDVIQGLRADLAALGEAALPELERLAAEHFAQRDGVHVLQNVLGVLWLSDAPGARAALVRHLAHPAELVRAQAIRGLVKHAAPEDYDALLAVLPLTSGATRPTLVEALQRADARRLEAQLAAWIVEHAEHDLWRGAVRLVLPNADRSSAERFAPLLERIVEPLVRIPLLGVLARGGHADALAELLAEFEDADPQRRTAALETLEHVGGHLELVARVLRADPELSLRVMAASLLKVHPDDAEGRRALRQALDDGAPEVRQMALSALLAVGDAQAADRVVASMGRERAEMQTALFAVREHWAANPGLADAVLEVLDRRQRAEIELAERDRKYLVQAIGLVPGRASAELLLELGRTRQGVVDKLSTHRFHVLHMGNTGPAGLALLRERYAVEPDPGRRMDYLWGALAGQDDTTRRFLIEVLLGERGTPHEKLLAADRLVRMGPAQEIAPLLKRATLRVEHPEVRVALQCLLWQWYG